MAKGSPINYKKMKGKPSKGPNMITVEGQKQMGGGKNSAPSGPDAVKGKK